MAVCWVILRGQQIYTVIQAVHSLLYIVAKCHFVSGVTYINNIYKNVRGVLTSVRYCMYVKKNSKNVHINLIHTEHTSHFS